MRSFLLSLLLVAFVINSYANQYDPVLMHVNGKPVHKSEFEYIYNKNNSNNSLDKKTLNEYVELFVNFKLKVEEAKAQGLDTTKAFIDELSGYRSQLTKPYLTDANVDEQIIREAYDRMKEDVEVSHILLRIPQNATPADTLLLWQKMMQIAKKLEKNNFETVAREVSEDESVKENGGNIGWISAFRTVYPFESVAYNTPKGSISKPFRTAFGYHILKVNNRRNTLGEVLVSHIMQFTTQGDEAKNNKAKFRIDSIYQRVLAGDDFGKLAIRYSDDKGSANKNGELPWFGTGRMVPEFENAAFALKNVGEVSVPIKSAYGWHIIKLIEKRGLAAYESVKEDIERKVKRDERASLGQKSFVSKLRSEYNLVLNNAAIDDFVKALYGKSLADSAYQVEILKLAKPLFRFANKEFSQTDFSAYLVKNAYSEKSITSDIISEKLNAFIDKELLKYEDTQLESKYDDFKFLINEYHDGILLFEISNNEVWDKASKDVEGLNKYFTENKADYAWEKPHFKGRIILCKDKETLKAAKIIVKNADNDSVDKYLKSRLNDSIQYVKIEKGIFVQGDNKAVDKYGFKLRNATYEPAAEYPFVLVTGKNLKNMPEEFADVRGLVTADYQEYLEKAWISALRKKYKVEVNEEVLKTVKSN